MVPFKLSGTGAAMVTYILALAFLHVPGAPPKLIAPHESREACMVDAAKYNRADEQLRSKGAREAGMEYVCLKIERATI
jgi:hypothetical protein